MKQFDSAYNRSTSGGNAKQYTIILDSVFINSFMLFVYRIRMLYSYRNNCSLGQKWTGVIPKRPLLFFTHGTSVTNLVLTISWPGCSYSFQPGKDTPKLNNKVQDFLNDHGKYLFKYAINKGFTFPINIVIFKNQYLTKAKSIVGGSYLQWEANKPTRKIKQSIID